MKKTQTIFADDKAAGDSVAGDAVAVDPVTDHPVVGDGVPAASAACRECLEQSEICCEQARAAARLRRFTAARGLFATAIAMCRRAIALSGSHCGEARDRLRRLEVEASVYAELVKSQERPL